MNLRIKKKNIYNFIVILLYKIVLDLAYYFIISSVWAYAKFTLNLNNLKLIESYFLLFLIFILIPKSSKKLSSVCLWVFFLMSYVPMLTLFALMDESRIFMYATTFFWMIVFLTVRIRVPKLNIRKLKQAKIIRWTIFIAISVISFLIAYKYFGLHINFSLKNVYEIRHYYVGLKIPFAGYILNWSAKIIGPLLLAIFFVKKKWIPLILVLVLQILLFSITGHKMYLFIIPFVFAMLWVVNKKDSLKWMAIGLAILTLISILSYYLIEDVEMSSVFTRRTLLVPAQLSFFYYDFFSNHEFTFLSQHRVFRSLTDYSYHLDPPHLIGETYYDSPKMGANNGILSDGYMNFGFIGMAIWAIVLSFILRLIDNFSKGKNIKIAFATIAVPILTIMGSALPTVLITHGLILSLLILYLLPKIKNIKKRYNE